MGTVDEVESGAGYAEEEEEDEKYEEKPEEEGAAATAAGAAVVRLWTVGRAGGTVELSFCGWK